MMDMFCKLDVKKTGYFAAGVLFGTAGIKVLSSKDAKRYMFPVLRLCSERRNAS